ncbi:L-selectin-like [Hemibagrus wyckioides]|uniref:L-selectin-like n=1 Tax=Hemibagrus wyckioides TaxID=337641 RepID=UPI00266C84E0|nr:L-selectin-like [Hemibagrus wyckioides]
MFFTVVCGIGAYISHRYHFVNKNKTRSEAQTYCRVNFTDLATINNMGEMKKLNHTLMKENAKKAWIGLQREGPGKWQWSLADQTFYRDGDTYRNWRSGQPDNDGGIEYCVEMHYNGLWNDKDCEKLNPFWSDQSNSSFRYWSSDKPSGGLNCCAVSESEKRYWSDKEMAQNASTEHVWLGLCHDCVQRVWFWVSGSMICYEDWAHGNGTWNEDCSHEKRSRGGLEESRSGSSCMGATSSTSSALPMMEERL